MPPPEIQQIANEQDRAFMSELYETYYPLMRRTVSKFRIDAHSADDIIIEACIRLFPKIPLLRAFESCVLRGYIVSTVRSVCLNTLSKRKLERQYTTEAPENQEFPDTGQTPEEIVEQKETAEMLARVMVKLSKRDQDLLTFKYLLGLSDSEIADILKIKPGSVRAYLTKARRNALLLLQEGGFAHER